MKKNNSILLSTPYILWMLAFTLIPLGVVGYYALTDPATGVFSLGNLRELGMYWGVLWESILYSLVSALICLLLGYPVAYYIAHCSETTQKILYMLVMLPMCMSFLLRTLAWVGLLQDTGLINRVLQLIGLPQTHMYSNGESNYRYPDYCLETVELTEYGGLESIYTDKDFSWAIYFSHENTVTFAGSIVPKVKELLEKEKEHWDKFEWN